MNNFKNKKFIPFGKPDFTNKEIEAITKVMESGWIGMGEETIKFEKKLSNYLQAPEVVTVNSCTSALFLSLLVEGVGNGDEVIVPSLTWYASANVIIYLGAKPVFCDVEENTMCSNLSSILKKITHKTKAIVVVHYGGYAIDIDYLRKNIPRNISIIEDSAHAFGSKYPNGKNVGSSQNSVCFSFYANKNLSTGEGGAIALFDKEKADRLRILRNNGLEKNAWKRYQDIKKTYSNKVYELGYKMNLTDLQSSIGLVQLKRIKKMNLKRSEIINYYLKEFKNLKINIDYQKDLTSPSHSKHLFVIKVNKKWCTLSRNKFLNALRANNIGATIHYHPLHLQKFYSSYQSDDLHITNKLYKEIVTLPISASMNLEDVEKVIKEISKFII